MDIVERASRAVSRQYGKVGLELSAMLREGAWRTEVARLLVDGPATLGSTVIAKSYVDRPTAVSEDGTPRERFCREEAGLRFLEDLGLDPPVSPHLVAADPDTLTIVMEDLGKGASLADHLTGDDPELAERSLLAYARTLGTIHAASVSRRGEHERIRGATFARIERVVAIFQEFACIAADLGVMPAKGLDQEIERTRQALANPGEYRAFTITDACPDNHFVSNAAVRFFDLEFAGFAHALLEGCYLVMPFPTCWCMGRLPDEVQAQALETYRRELEEGIAAARDRKQFNQEMTVGCAYWTVHLADMIRGALKEDEQWGLVGVRVRIVHWLETFIRLAEAADSYPALTELCSDLATVLRDRWKDDELEMPLYPAFRGSRQPSTRPSTPKP